MADEEVVLSSQEYTKKAKNEEGYRHLSCFYFEDLPQWISFVKGVEVKKTLSMKQGENLIALQYEISNQSPKDIIFSVSPYLQFMKKGKTQGAVSTLHWKENAVCTEEYTLYIKTNGTLQKEEQQEECFYYAYDICDGREESGRAATNHRIEKVIKAGKKECLEIIYSMEESKETVKEIFEKEILYRKKLSEQAGFQEPLAQVLSKSANQFLSERASTKGKTILAGFPFFEDWGRDTMIAITGCCISVRQYEAAANILRTFAQYCRKGIMPNLFPEGKNKPMYNTVDAALLFIHAVYRYYKETKDESFVREVWNVMQEIIFWYRNGTDFNIYMDKDGLISAGKSLDQVTWMDVRIGLYLPTPRHGKPVEINAYWYNALCMMEEMKAVIASTEISGEKRNAQKIYTDDYGRLAEKVKKSFQKEFWNPKKQCLRDVLTTGEAQDQIRCNQIWAVSLPFSVLEREQEKQVVRTVYEKLYTPYGLRTLEMEDKEFKGIYKGPVFERDSAYHQGTVWVFPLGAWYLAYLKTEDYRQEAIETVKGQLEVLESALREGCVGQLPEIYDGENPTVSRGCFAQAWSVGEILQVYALLEQIK